MELKHYRLNGLNYYVSDVLKEIAVVVCLKNRWGVTETTSSKSREYLMMQNG